MQRFVGYIMEKFGELGPVRRLFKFFFGRIFSNLIDREIKLSDFKNHILELENLPLSVQKINKIYLSESPYCLHSGVIGKLKIKLASFKELTTKDIEVAIDRIHLVFKFNPSYCKPKGPQQSQSLSTEPDVQDIDLQDDDDDDEDLEEEKQAKKNQPTNQQKKGKKDMFKQFIRQVLSNIKFSMNGITIDLFMNEPAAEKEKTISQVFLRLHLQKLKIYQQKKDSVLKKLRVAKDEGDNLYWIKLRELSAFILNEKASSNKIPTIDNPACIFACSFKMKQVKQAVEDANKEGNKNLNSSYFFDWTASVAERDMTGQNQDDEAFLPNHFQIELLFNPNDGRVKGLKVYLPPVEFQVDPIQFRVLRNYLEQFQAYDQMRRLSEFKKSGFKELDLFPLKMRQQESEFQEEDKQIDSSFAIPLATGQNAFLLNHSYLQQIGINENGISDHQNKELPSSDPSQNQKVDNAAIPNSKPVDDEFSFSNLMSSEIEFDFYESQLDFKIIAVNAYFLKQRMSQNAQKRGWIYYYSENPETKLQQQQHQPSQRICTSLNDQIPTNYFMFSLKLLQLQTGSKLLKTISLQSVKILDVSLVESKGLCNIKPEAKRPSGLQIPSLFGAPPSNSQLFTSSQKFNFGKTNSPKRPRQNMYASIRSSPPLAPISAQPNSNCDLYSSSIFQSCLDNNEMGLNSQMPDIPEEMNFPMQANNQEDDDLFMSIDNSQFFHSTVSQLKQVSQVLEKIEEEDKPAENKEKKSKDGAKTKDNINKSSSKLQQAQVGQALGGTNQQNQEELFDEQAAADWRLDPERQHYCVSYVLLIKPVKMDQQRKVSNTKGNILNEVGGAFKEKILAQSSWHRDSSSNNNNNKSSSNKNNPIISEPLQQGFSAQLVKLGSEIKIEGVISQVFIAAHYNLLRDVTKILLSEQSSEWREYSSNSLATDKKLSTPESISKLEEFNAFQGKILLFEEKEVEDNKDNTNNTNSNNNNNQMKNMSISVTVKGVKCGWLPYRDLLKEIDAQPRKCFCDVLRYPRESKSYGIVFEIKDMQVQNGLLNYSQTNSNISNKDNNSNSSNSSISVNIAQITAGLVKLSRSATLDSSKELFTVFPLMEITQIKLSLSQFASSRRLNLQTQSISLCVWKLNTILDLSKAISSQYETLLTMNNTNPSDSAHNIKNSCEDKLQRQEPSAEMLEFQQQQEVLSVELNVKELQLRFAYSQKWKTDKKNGTIPRKSQQQQEQIQDKHTLGSWIGACAKLQSKLKLQSYYAVTQLSISENYTLELLLLNSFVHVNSSSRASIYIEKTCKLECAIFEIYLIDNQQTLVHLSDYQYPTMSDRQQIYCLKTPIGFSREVNDYKLLIYSASSFLPQDAKNYWSKYSSEQDINYSNPATNHSRINQLAGSQIKSQIKHEGNNFNLSEDSIAMPFLHLRLSVKSTCPSLSQQNNQFSQKISSNAMPTSTTMVKISALNIGNVNVRFGDFSSRPIENILYHISHFQKVEKQSSNEKEASQKAQPSDLLELPKASAVVGSSSKEVLQTSQISIFLKNGCFHDIMIDLFPLHDPNIRKSYPKVFEGISSSNVSKSYYTNQRSVLNIKKVEISLFQYDSSSSSISLNAQILGIELLTLIFNDFNMFINPLLLRTNQLPLLQQNPPTQAQLIMLNDYIYTLGFTPIFEIDASVGFDATSVKLQINRCQLGACKDSFTALPLHFAILSLLFNRLIDFSSTSSHINEKFGEEQSADSRIKDSKISNKDWQIQGSELKEQNNQGSLLKSSNSKDKNEMQFFEQVEDKREKKFDENDFEKIDEEFMLSINRSEEAGEKAKKKFIQDAKEKDILYFHSQGMENAGEIKQKIDFSIENLEIQLFSGRNFDFEELSSLNTVNSSSMRTASSLASNMRNQKTNDSRISIPAVGNNSYLRHRRTEKSYNQSLLLSLNGLHMLYSQSSQKQKLNLVIQAINIVGTAEGKSSTILQKKDNNINNTQAMILTDILIDNEKNQVFIKANIDRLKLVVDKAYKNLFEDLSSIKLDPKCASNEMNEDMSLYNSEIQEFDEEDSHKDEGRSRKLFSSDDNEGEDNEKDEDDDDEYEICESESTSNQNNNQSSSSQYKLCLLQINGLQCEITVNWVLSSILKDSLLQWDELYLESENGKEINAALSEKIIRHYTQLFSKNQQLIKLLTNVVLIRNISNLAKGVADLFILPYSSLVSKDTKLTDGILQGVKGLQNTLLTETHNLFSVARSIYNTCIRQNLNPLKRIKKLFKPNKK